MRISRRKFWIFVVADAVLWTALALAVLHPTVYGLSHDSLNAGIAVHLPWCSDRSSGFEFRGSFGPFYCEET